MKQPRTFLSIMLRMVIPVAVIAAGCKKEEEIRSFHAPKDAVSTTTSGDAAGSDAQSADDLHWTLPADWKRVPPPPARSGIQAVAAFQVSPQDPKFLLTITKLGPGGREIQGNLIRWSRILKRGMPSEQELAKALGKRQIAGIPCDVVDLRNDALKLRLLAAIVPHEQDTWAISLLGDSDQVAQQPAHFDEFLGSLSFGPADQDSAPAPRSPAADTGAAGAHWILPTGWSSELSPPGGLRVATIHPADNGATEIKVSTMEGDAGGLSPNVNRWRGEVGLEPAAPDQGVPLTVGNQLFTIRDYTGPGGRVIIAAAKVNGNSWFFKISGSADAVASAKPAFDLFVRTISFGP